MKHWKIVCAAVIAVTSAAWAQQRTAPPQAAQPQQPAQKASPSVLKELQETARRSATLINAKDFDQFVQQFAENALLVTADGQRHEGRSAIRSGIQRETTSGMLVGMQLQIDVLGARTIGSDLAIVEFRQTLTPMSVGGAGMEGTGGAGEQGGTAQPPTRPGTRMGAQAKAPVTLEGVAVAHRVGDRWQLSSSHIFPSRELLRQQAGVGGSGPSRPMTPPTPKR